MTKNNAGFFNKTSVHVICYILGLGSVVAAAYTASSGHTEASIVLSIAAIALSVFGFAVGFSSEQSKKACECEEKKTAE